MLLSLFFSLFFPDGLRLERGLRMSLTRTVAGAGSFGRLRFAWFAVPYRPNRVYYRLAVRI